MAAGITSPSTSRANAFSSPMPIMSSSVDLKTDHALATLDSAGAHGVAFAPDLHRGFISNGANGTVTVFDLQTLQPLQSVRVGENPDAICYEPVTRRVFAFNGRSHTASVLDAVTGQSVGEIALPGRPEFAQVDGARLRLRQHRGHGARAQDRCLQAGHCRAMAPAGGKRAFRPRHRSRPAPPFCWVRRPEALCPRQPIGPGPRHASHRPGSRCRQI